MKVNRKHQIENSRQTLIFNNSNMGKTTPNYPSHRHSYYLNTTQSCGYGMTRAYGKIAVSLSLKPN